MRRFFNDIKHYGRYIIYSARCQLKDEVAGSFLNWGWLVLNPVMFMLVYAFVQIAVFGNAKEYLASFCFVGLTVWNFFNTTVNGSVRIIKRYKAIISKTYVPKFCFVMTSILVNGFKMLVSFGLVLVSLLLYRVPVSPLMLWSIPYLLLLVLMSFGISCILLHYGVYFEDLSNIVPIVLRLMFFMSGVFYDLEGKMEGNLGVLVERLNPTAFIILQIRRTLIYGQSTSKSWFLLWAAVGLMLSVIGVHLIYKHERTYVKSV